MKETFISFILPDGNVAQCYMSFGMTVRKNVTCFKQYKSYTGS